MIFLKDLRENFKHFREKTALITRQGNFTFGQLEELSIKLAFVLRDRGVKKGSRVALFLPNSLDLVVSYLSIFRLGAVAVPLDEGLKPEELLLLLGHAEAEVLISQPIRDFKFVELKEKLGTLRHIITTESCEAVLNMEEIKKSRLPNQEIPVVESNPQDEAAIFYTSGTTGRPKGALWRYRHLDATLMAMEYYATLGLSEKDIGLCAIPLSHCAGLIFVQNAMHFGLAVVLMEQFVPAEFLRNIQQHGVTCSWLVPMMFVTLLQVQEFEQCDLSSLRWLVVFGAPSSAEVLRKFQRYCPEASLYHGYGLTETAPPNTVCLPNQLETVGKPPPWIEIKIVDQDDRPLPAGEVGEIAIKGWVVMDGYYKEPGLTSSAMTSGFFHTGDLGTLTAEGNLTIVGRKKDMIIVGGLNVWPQDIEGVLLRHPKIAEVAVIGVPDKVRGEAVKAVVVLKQGFQVEPEQIRAFCRKHLASFKVPYVVEFVSSLPKTPSGKVQKEELRKLHKANEAATYGAQPT